jgi:hypothetical protein
LSALKACGTMNVLAAAVLDMTKTDPAPDFSSSVERLATLHAAQDVELEALLPVGGGLRPGRTRARHENVAAAQLVGGTVQPARVAGDEIIEIEGRIRAGRARGVTPGT